MTSAAKLRTGMRMTLGDFLARDETDGKWELDDGVLYITASGSPDHQFLMMEFSRHILAHVDQFEVPPAELYHEMTTVLSRELQRAPEPDIVIILAQSRGIVGGSRVEGTPDIVVEILSGDRNRDLIRKREIYAEAGVTEYWPIDPRNDTVTQLELRGGVYVERAVLGPGDVLTTPLLLELVIPLLEIFHHRRRPPREG